MCVRFRQEYTNEPHVYRQWALEDCKHFWIFLHAVPGIYFLVYINQCVGICLQISCTDQMTYDMVNVFSEPLNTYHVSPKCPIFYFFNVNILEFQDHVWNQHKKCIQISTNMS